MPDQSEVIMGQMEDTRKDLATKLESLEKKVTETVGTVTGTVAAVENSVESVKESIQETVASVTDTVQNTVQAVEETVSNTVANVRSFFDVAHQVDSHPWLMMSGSMLLGFLGGRLLTPRSSRTQETPASVPTYTPTPVAPPAAPAAKEPERTEETGESWIGKLGDHFAPEVEKLKGLAVGTLFGVARDMISQWLPHALKDQVTDVLNSFTTDLGGKVIREPLLVQPQQEEARTESESHEQPSQSQAAEKSQAGAGSHKPEKAGGRSGRR